MTVAQHRTAWTHAQFHDCSCTCDRVRLIEYLTLGAVTSFCSEAFHQQAGHAALPGNAHCAPAEKSDKGIKVHTDLAQIESCQCREPPRLRPFKHLAHLAWHMRHIHDVEA